MPTYEYACRSCDTHLEVVQRFDDDPLTECPSCGGQLRKVFGSIGISFKGSGFYKTDSRSLSKTGAPSKAAGDGEGSTASTSGDGASSSSADAASSTSNGTGDGAAKQSKEPKASPSTSPTTTTPATKSA